MKGKIILGSLIVLFIALAVPNVSAETVCKSCHLTYYNAVNAIQHANSDGCIICHQGSYDTSTHTAGGNYIGYVVNETTCKASYCHSPTSVNAPPVSESHGNKYYPPNGKADCTQCHLANTTQKFPLNNSLYVHDHNFTVEYNFYNYNLSGMPLSTNGGVGKGMFPYYTCTLTCHSTYKIEDEVVGWNLSKHARSYEGVGDNNAYCAKCKSPPNYNLSVTYLNRNNYTIDPSNWQGIQCRICHNIHNDTYSGKNPPAFPLAFYNTTATLQSSTGSAVYDQVSNATVLCQNCHSNRNFAGVHVDTAGFDCADCHANKTFSNYNHTFAVKNTTSGVEGCAVCHNSADHTWEQTSKHTNVECWACHDQTVIYNATSGNATSPGNTFGIWNDPSTGNWTTYKLSHGAPASWVLHNITKSVSCDKCHIANSTYNGTIGPALTCSGCHTSYASVVNASKHNQTLYSGAPANCTVCHSGYQPSYGHTTGNSNYIVNGSNTCQTSGCHNSVQKNMGGRNGDIADCTDCHFANTTQPFNLNPSLSTHDHNLTVEYNFYNYNLSGIPLSTNGGVGKGMFPYYTCTLTCHDNSDSQHLSIEDKVIGWNLSKHARSREGDATYDSNAYCAKCKSPPNYNLSAGYVNRTSYSINASDWQGIQCRICHNLHNDTYSGNGTSPVYIAFYNTTATLLTGNVTYDAVPNATVLCNNCHSNRNFAGVHVDTAGFDCADCHANKTFSNYNHTFAVKNTTSGVEGCAVCHNSADHTWDQTSKHTNVDCWACHDRTVVYNATSGNATSPGNTFGIWQDPSTGNWTTYKLSHGAPASWVLHNITRSVDCNKCHIANSAYNGTIGPALSCSECHPTYGNAVNLSRHNRTLNVSAPVCTDCHAGYQPSYGHITGNNGYTVNGSNTCTNNSACHAGKDESMGILANDLADCTDCHFANTTQPFRPFGISTPLSTHDHNLTVEYNFYNYNLSGIPLSTNGGVGKGMFPYYTCTLTCHDNSDSQHPRIEDKVIGWSQSKHAQSREGDATYDSNAFCAQCKSPPNYNLSAGYLNRTSYPINASDWQGIQCRICHNLHNDTYSGGNQSAAYPLAFYNTTATLLTGSVVYNQVANATVLCEKCHQPGTGHDSKYAGVHKDTVGFDCADCHVNATYSNSNHTFNVQNTTSGVEGCEVCHTYPGTAHSLIYSYHNNVTCWACHDQTVVTRNATNYSLNGNYGIYKDTSTNNWTTYQVSHGSAATWPLHNISKNVTCAKCHGARSLYTAGGIAPGFGGDLTYIAQVTDLLVSGYNQIIIYLLPDPAISAKNLLYPSSGGIPGVTKVMKWDSTSQSWVSYIYDGSTYVGTNFTLYGKNGYFIMGNSSTAGQTYTFSGIR